MKLDELKFYRGSIARNMKSGSDMLKIRVLPNMKNTPIDDLPAYPMFDATKVLHGVSEEDTKDTALATQVWLLATDDFKIGFIVCEAVEETSTNDDAVDVAYNFNGLYKHLSLMNLNTNSVDYRELKVLYTNNRFQTMYANYVPSSKNKSVKNSDYIDVVNIRTGERWWVMGSGTAFAFMQNKIVLRCGSPNDKHSKISMDPSNIEMVADTITIYGRKNTSLGKHGMNVVGMLGAPTAVDGSPLVAFEDLTM